MKGAKELAGILRHMRDHLSLDDIQKGILRESAAHLDAKAAIDSAVPGEVGEILRRPERLTDADAAILLDIVQRQAGEIAELRAHPPFSIDARLSVDLTTARAEVERLKSEKTALAAENARLVNEHAAAMSRADVLAEGVRHWRLSMRNGFATLATQNWELQHGHMVSK